jgi:hypothetical protein
LEAELFVPELLEAAPPFFAAAVLLAAPLPDLAVDLDAAPFFAEVFAEPVFVEDLPLADFAAPAEPDFAAPDLADEDLAEPDFAAPDFAVADFAPPDFAAVDLALPVFDADDFEVEDFAVELFDEPEDFAPPFAAPDVREREDELFDPLDVPATVSAAAPSAPTAAPCAAPPKISPATSITASMTFSVVDFRPPELFELADEVPFDLFCVDDFLSGMIFSLNRIEQMFVLKLSHIPTKVIQIFESGLYFSRYENTSSDRRRGSVRTCARCTVDASQHRFRHRR